MANEELRKAHEEAILAILKDVKGWADSDSPASAERARDAAEAYALLAGNSPTRGGKAL